jgi:hypothetical protein
MDLKNLVMSESKYWLGVQESFSYLEFPAGFQTIWMPDNAVKHVTVSSSIPGVGNLLSRKSKKL